MIQIAGSQCTRTFTVDLAGIATNAPFHEANMSAFLRELQQRGLRPSGDVTIGSIDEQEPDRYGQPRTVITYAVSLQQPEEI